MRRQVREEQNRRFRTFLRRASVSSLVPGLGMILSGRKAVGWTLLLAFVAAVGGLVAVLLTTPRDDLVALAVNPRVLVAASAVLAVVAISLLVSSAASHHLLQPAGIRRGQRVVAASVVVVLTSLVVAPVALASRYAWVQHDLVSTVFAAAPVGVDSGDDNREVPPADPWEGVGRVTLLLMGSDAGPDREGTRPDTNVVATVDTETGDAVLFSLPRNMENVPFPADSPLSELYPGGWPEDPNDLGSGYLNAIYRYVPAAHPELFANEDDPGAAAMMLAAEGITGLPIDYYVMVDLDGFQQVVDALGGIDINVQQRIPIGSAMLPNGVCSPAQYYLEPGLQTLNGYDALWYARVRCGGPGLSDDYDRMRRQRCVIGAMVDKADPVTVLRRYESLASTAQQIVHTDIPSDKVAAFATLGMRVQGGSIRSLPFTNVIIDPADPDYDLIQAEVQAALVPPPPPPTATPDASESAPATPTPGTGGSTSPEATPSPSPGEESGPVDLNSVC
jgi:LCP family protein required for cell wall assembly